jgi:hypothetical protein
VVCAGRSAAGKPAGESGTVTLNLRVIVMSTSSWLRQ